MKQHWYLVAHRAGARLFVQEGIKPKLQVLKRFENPKGKLKDSELVSDRQGRSDQMGHPGHTAVGSDDSPRAHVLQTFARQLGDFLEAEAEKNSFESLVVVAEPHVLGEINKFVRPATASRQRDPVHKDLVHVSDHDMAEALGSALCSREDVRPHGGHGVA